jgi:hypothetical protein
MNGSFYDLYEAHHKTLMHKAQFTNEEGLTCHTGRYALPFNPTLGLEPVIVEF